MTLFTYDNISWNLPLMFCHDDLIFAVGDVLKDFPDVKRPKFFSYGSITSPWSGGRCTYVKFFDNKFMENHLNKIIDSGFIPTFTFTKPFVKNEDLNDKLSNWILDYGVEHDCEFLVTSENLYQHIRERHPDAKLAASILKGKMEFHKPKEKISKDPDYELNFYNELLDRYDRVVVRPEYAIEGIERDLDKIKDVGRLEVLLNETCLPNCPYAIPCYCSMDNKITNPDADKPSICGREEISKNTPEKKSLSYTVMIRKSLADHLVFDCGVRHLKVQGRHYPSLYLYNLVLYHVFNVAGNFQSIYPAIMRKAMEYKEKDFSLPLEQKEIMAEFYKKQCINFI